METLILIERLKFEIEGLKRDIQYVDSQVSISVINTGIELREEQLKTLEFKLQAERKMYMQVKYVGGMDFYDGLTTGKEYGVYDENETQYMVVNDMSVTSRISKDKFNIVNG